MSQNEWVGTEELFSPPQEPAQPKRSRGRPPGSTNKPKLAGPESAPFAEPAPKVSMITLAMRKMLAGLKFSSMGTADRTLLVILRDVSPSEREYEEQFRVGGNAIAPVLAADRLAANLVDVVLCHGAEDLTVVKCDHAKDFVMPETVEYGKGTFGAPWFQKVPHVVTAYREHLAELGLGVANIFVLVASDMLFGDKDEVVEALRAFRDLQHADPKFIVIPAGYGKWEPSVAEKVSVRVKPVDLNALRITDFIRVVANSVREISYSRPEERSALIAKFDQLSAQPQQLNG